MRTLLLLPLIFSASALALSGKSEISVQKSKHSDFKGFLWNHVDETIGPGESPKLTQTEVLEAIREEFTEPDKALAQLEKLKGLGGKLVMEYAYVEPSKDRPENDGNLRHKCGVVDEKSKNYNLYVDWGVGIVSPGKDFKEYPRYSDEGKFFQFKWASKAQLRRHIAKCFSRLPGMPQLRPRNPEEKPELFFDEDVYKDFHHWFGSIPGISIGSPQDKRFRNSVQCLLQSGLGKNADRSGNVLVLQKVEKSKKDKASTFVSEIDNLPSYSDAKQSRGKNTHTYSLAFMDQESWGKMKKNWSKDEIKTQGIWPNYQGGSVASLMGQALGDQLHVNMKACFLQAGLRIEDPNQVLPTVYNPFECREVDSASIPPQEQLEYYCGNGKAESCFFIGAGHHQGKKFSCLPKEYGGKCTLIDGKQDIVKAKTYYDKACELGMAEGCYALASVLDAKDPIFQDFNNEAMTYYQKGCRRKESTYCLFYNRGLSHVDESNRQAFESACLGPFQKRKSCHSLGLYHLQKGDTPKAKELLRKGCEARGFKKLPSPCVELANLLLKEDAKEEAKKILQSECSFIDKVSCRELFELSSQKEKDELIKRVCWQTKELCF